ncbi:MAG: DUF3048 domain-containing protein, partial [Candidatus Promineifilaceae bacterium]
APTASLGRPPTPPASPEAAPANSPTPAASPTAEVVLLDAPQDFGLDRNPLTGEKVADPAVLDRRPLEIKVSNAPPEYVRPQAGLNSADLVFEHVTEAGITRFSLLVYGQTPAKVGPIRSARMIDLELPAMYDAALVYSGAHESVRQRLLASDFRGRILWSNDPGYYRTGENKPFEHTLYGVPETFWQSLEQRGENTRPKFNTWMSFSSQAPAGGQPAGNVHISYRTSEIDWRYDAARGRYLRWTDAKPHLDANTSQQVSAANVVALFAYHIEDYNICVQEINGQCAFYSIQPQVYGAGPAILFRDGQRYDGTWQRAGRYDMFTFVDAAGRPMPLQIGNTWLQLIPNHYDQPVTVSP